MDREVWVPVIGYEKLYEISSRGRVRSLSKTITDKCGRYRAFFGKILKPKLDHGYHVVCLYKNTVKRFHRVHRLALGSFLEVCDLHIDHINGTRNDNSIANLRYCTPSQNNANKRSQKGSISKFKGVYICENKKSWYAQICIEGVKKGLGIFTNEVDAAKAYDKAAST